MYDSNVLLSSIFILAWYTLFLVSFISYKYQKTYTGTTSSSATETQVATWTNSYVIREYKGGYTQASGTYVPICYTASTTDWMIPYTENGKLMIGYSAGNKGKSYWLTVLYTK